MPFIDPAFLLNDEIPLSRLLITSADDSDVIKTSFELAKVFSKTENPILWVDGNLGERLPTHFPLNPDLEKVISGQLPLTYAIKKHENIFILTGKAEHFLAELPETKQYQFLQDLKNIYPHFQKVIITVDGKNPTLQKKWMKEVESAYLLFNCKNLFAGRTATWLETNKNLVKGLIGIGKNDQEVLLTYLRLKEILGSIPELILDIKKIAP